MNLDWKLRRIALSLRQLDIAQRAELSQSRYCSLEKGDVQPTDDERRRIEEILLVPPEIGRQLVSTFTTGGQP